MVTKEMMVESAAHWRKLAEEQRRLGEWDVKMKISDGRVHGFRAELYENTAKSIEKEMETGTPHCACHVIPLAECAKRVRS